MPEITSKPGQRSATLTLRADTEGARTYEASLSSESEARQWFGREILDHSAESIDLSRAEGSGLPLLWNHSRDQNIGRVVNVRLDKAERRLRGEFVFSEHSELAKRVKAEVDDGLLGDVSISYEITDFREEMVDEQTIYRITGWQPNEASIVTVAADPSVGVGRQHPEGNAMPDENQPGKGNEVAGGAQDTSFSSARELGLKQGHTDGIRAERARVSEINDLFAVANRSGAEFEALKQDAIVEGWTIEATSRKLLSLVGGTPAEPVNTAQPNAGTQPDAGNRAGEVQAGADAIDKFAEGAARALEVRGNLVDLNQDVRREMRQNQFGGHSLVELARESLIAMNVNTAGMDRVAVARAAFRPDLASGQRTGLVGHSTSVFTNILENIATKALLRGYDETDETWMQWCRVGNLSDFKQASRAGLSQFDDLDVVVENGEYKHGTFDDRKESIQLVKYGKLFAVTYEAIVNDDLDAMTVVPRRMGRAAARVPGDLAYAILTSNPTLNQDATALFDAGHSNLGTSGVLSVTTLSEARRLMALQTDQNNQANGLNIRPRYLIVPVTIEDTARVIVASERDPSEGTTTSFNAPNPVQNIATVVSDPRLDASSTAQWYMAADPNVTDTVEVAFLNGNQEPVLESRDGWTVDGVEYKVRLECAAAALDFRGLVRNAGT